jgi:peptide/nickel transport system permease protein
MARILTVPLLLLGISAILFATMHLIPGGPEAMLAGPDVDPSVVEELRKSLGLDRPVYVQYARWLGQVAQGHFGVSFRDGQPVAEHIRRRFWPTVQLALSGLIVAVGVGIPLGVIAGRYPHSFVGQCADVMGLVGLSIPSFWLGIMMILLFSGVLGWLPSSGIATYGLEDSLLSRAKHAALPTLTIASVHIVEIMKYTRSGILEALQQDYVRTARAKGLTEGATVYRHVLRNVLIPVITVIGLSLPSLVGGAVITETIFSWPGLGRLAIDSVVQRDYPIVIGTNIVIAVVVVLSNLLTDITYTIVDPRVSHR